MTTCQCDVITVLQFGVRDESWGKVCKRCGMTLRDGIEKDMARIEEEAKAAKLREEQEKLERAEQEKKAKELYAKSRPAEIEKRVDAWRKEVDESVSSGNEIISYRSVFIPVDSVIQGEQIANFNIDPIRALGLTGWRIVGIIPKTAGEALKNLSTSGTTWGAGMGGNVLGVHVLLERKVRASDIELQNEAKELGESLVRQGINLETMKLDLPEPE